jgi:hypothetical protein
LLQVGSLMLHVCCHAMPCYQSLHRWQGSCAMLLLDAVFACRAVAVAGPHSKAPPPNQQPPQLCSITRASPSASTNSSVPK